MMKIVLHPLRLTTLKSLCHVVNKIIRSMKEKVHLFIYLFICGLFNQLSVPQRPYTIEWWDD
jgi:hypothetical protein